MNMRHLSPGTTQNGPLLRPKIPIETPATKHKGGEERAMIGPLWVDCGPSVSGRKSAAVGGFLPFAATRSGDKSGTLPDPLTRLGTGTFGPKPFVRRARDIRRPAPPFDPEPLTSFRCERPRWRAMEPFLDPYGAQLRWGPSSGEARFNVGVGLSTI